MDGLNKKGKQMSETKTWNLAPKDDLRNVTTLRGDTLEAASIVALEKLGYVVTEEVPNYYVTALEPLDKSGYPRIQIYTTGATTKWLDLNMESVKIITDWMWDCVCWHQNPERKEDNAP